MAFPRNATAPVSALIGLLLATAVTVPGCTSIAKATSEYAPTETVLAAKADLVGPIAKAVIEDYGFAQVEGSHTRVAGQYAALADGEPVVITLTPAGSRTTRIVVSNDASKQVAEDVLREIERRLDAVLFEPEPLPWLQRQSAPTPRPRNPPEVRTPEVRTPEVRAPDESIGAPQAMPDSKLFDEPEPAARPAPILIDPVPPSEPEQAPSETETTEQVGEVPTGRSLFE
jgi:hypothetical protein